MTVSAEITKYPAASSDFPEDSPNSLPSDERKLDNGEVKVPAGDLNGIPHPEISRSKTRLHPVHRC